MRVDCTQTNKIACKTTLDYMCDYTRVKIQPKTSTHKTTLDYMCDYTRVKIQQKKQHPQDYTRLHV